MNEVMSYEELLVRVKEGIVTTGGTVPSRPMWSIPSQKRGGI